MLSYGGVELIVTKADELTVKRGVDASRLALRRIAAKLARPGVKLERTKGVPHFRADPENRGVLIRQLDDKLERGIFNGRDFQVIE
jgi:hypothetical protein